MHRRSLAGPLALLLCAVWAGGVDAGLLDKAKSVGSAVGGAAKSAGSAVGGAAKTVGRTVGSAAKTTGRAVGGAARKTGSAIANATHAVGERISSSQVVSRVRSMGISQKILSGLQGHRELMEKFQDGLRDRAPFGKAFGQLSKAAKERFIDAARKSAQVRQLMLTNPAEAFRRAGVAVARTAGRVVQGVLSPVKTLESLQRYGMPAAVVNMVRGQKVLLEKLQQGFVEHHPFGKAFAGLSSAAKQRFLQAAKGSLQIQRLMLTNPAEAFRMAGVAVARTAGRVVQGVLSPVKTLESLQRYGMPAAVVNMVRGQKVLLEKLQQGFVDHHPFGKAFAGLSSAAKQRFLQAARGSLQIQRLMLTNPAEAFRMAGVGVAETAGRVVGAVTRPGQIVGDVLGGLSGLQVSSGLLAQVQKNAALKTVLQRGLVPGAAFRTQFEKLGVAARNRVISAAHRSTAFRADMIKDPVSAFQKLGVLARPRIPTVRPQLPTSFPKLPVVPGVKPKIPPFPGLPKVPTVRPQLPTSFPKLPVVPGVKPKIPPFPGLPKVPTVRPQLPTSFPGLPKIPTVRPQLPTSFPRLPVVPGVKPKIPPFPGLPKVPTVRPQLPPSFPGLPKVPTVRPQLPTSFPGLPKVPTVRPQLPPSFPKLPVMPGPEVLSKLQAMKVPGSLMTALRRNPQAMEALGKGLQPGAPLRRTLEKMPAAQRQILLQKVLRDAKLQKLMVVDPVKALQQLRLPVPR